MTSEIRCTWLRDRMERFVEHAFSQDEYAFLEEHATHCTDCGKLLEILSDDVVMPESEGERLTECILDQTAGRGCDRALSLYMYQIDDDIPDRDRELMNSHLRYCSSCQEVITTMNELFPVMQNMAELQPDPWFATDVIRRTRQLRWHERGLVARISDWWERFTASPQFEIQTAYVGALIFSLTIGSSIPSIIADNSIPERLVENSRTAVTAALSPLEEWSDAVVIKVEEGWNRSGGRIVGYAESLLSGIRRRMDYVAPRLDSAENHFGKMIDAVEDGELLDGMVHLAETGYDLKNAVIVLFTHIEEDPCRVEPGENIQGAESLINTTNGKNNSTILWRVS